VGLILDTSVLITAERLRLTPAQAVSSVQAITGEIAIGLSALSVAELGHGIYRASSEERRNRRRAFVEEVKATLPIYSMTVQTAEIVARVDGEQAAKGQKLPLSDLIIGACALELGYAIGTHNFRDFERIPGLTVIRL